MSTKKSEQLLQLLPKSLSLSLSLSLIMKLYLTCHLFYNSLSLICLPAFVLIGNIIIQKATHVLSSYFLAKQLEWIVKTKQEDDNFLIMSVKSIQES